MVPTLVHAPYSIRGTQKRRWSLAAARLALVDWMVRDRGCRGGRARERGDDDDPPGDTSGRDAASSWRGVLRLAPRPGGRRRGPPRAGEGRPPARRRARGAAARTAGFRPA